MKTEIRNLIAEKKRMDERKRKVDQALKLLRELCEHDFKLKTMGGKQDLYICKHCGIEKID